MTEKPQYIFFRESFVQSILADIFSFGILLFSFWVNHKFIGSKLLAGILLVLFVMGAFTKAASKMQKFYSKEALLEYVKSL